MKYLLPMRFREFCRTVDVTCYNGQSQSGSGGHAYMVQAGRWNNRLKAIALGIGLALTMLTVRHWYGTFMDGHPPCNDCRADFPGFCAAAKLIWEKPSAHYDNASQLAIQKAIDNRIGDSILQFAYPPVTALVLMPLGWLSFRMAFVAITLVNMALLLFM